METQKIDWGYCIVNLSKKNILVTSSTEVEIKIPVDQITSMDELMELYDRFPSQFENIYVKPAFTPLIVPYYHQFLVLQGDKPFQKISVELC